MVARGASSRSSRTASSSSTRSTRSRAARASRGGADVSREGVQRDLLPLIEGTTVTTKHGPVKTDHILFIASGAFHLAKPSDLLPELQGRLPIRVELAALTRDDFAPHPDRARGQPDQAVQGAAGDRGGDARLHRRRDRRDRRRSPPRSTSTVENIGARRLHTVLEKLLEEISFTATDRAGDDRDDRRAPMSATRSATSGQNADLSQVHPLGGGGEGGAQGCGAVGVEAGCSVPARRHAGPRAHATCHARAVRAP